MGLCDSHEDGVLPRPQNLGKRILMVLTNHDKLGDTETETGWYLPEAAHPYHVFKDTGCKITWASPKGGATPLDPASIDLADAGNKSFYEDKAVYGGTQDTMALAKCRSEDYDCIFFVGGFGTMWDFPDDENIHRLVREMYE